MKYLADLFNMGFQGYYMPVNLNSEQMKDIILKENIALNLSYEIINNNNPIGFCLTGIRDDVAWCGGIGITPDFRGQGLGKRLLTECIAELCKSNLKYYQLECIKENERALKLYRSLGFKWTGDLFNFKLAEPKPIEIDFTQYELTLGSELDLIKYWADLHPIKKSWQGDLPALLYNSDQYQIKILKYNDLVQGMIVYKESEKGVYIADLGVRNEDALICQRLLAELHSLQKTIMVMYIPEQSVLTDVFSGLGYEHYLDQVRMELVL